MGSIARLFDDAPRSAPARRWVGIWLALGVLLLPGCGGCNSTAKVDEQDKLKAEEAKKKEKPKPDFERLDVSTQPSETSTPIKMIKPGHWIAATVRTRANNFDFQGELDTAVTEPGGKLLDLERTPYQLTTNRPVLLPKGQQRELEVSLFVPRGRTRTWIGTTLRDRQSGRTANADSVIFGHLPAYEYLLVGLVKEPQSYRFLKVLPSVRLAQEDLLGGTEQELHYYRVQLPMIRQNAPLPSDSLCWTSLAYVIWDDIDPSALNKQQQQALIDWLHWGGQLIVSGPNTLDLLKPSFLGPYLPATAGDPLEIGEQSLAALNAGWTVEGELSRPLTAAKSWLGVQLEPQPEAEFVRGTGDLVVERRVGRGRITATAFRLVERELLHWPSFDSFFNGCLLHRPRRSYAWTDRQGIQFNWTDIPEHRLDPRLVTQLRYFSRDAISPTASKEDESNLFGEENKTAFAAANVFGAPPGSYSGQFDEEQEDRRAGLADSGVAAWNDFGPVAAAARHALKEAAGITIPRRDFVLKVLLAYLFVLVPLNWTLFRLLGRVEWAWVAAPGIAMVCAVVVVWLAQLDIGFARSNTEIAVVELQAGYPRAHITRFTALYTSLSTTYQVKIAEPTALVLPFSSDPQFQMLAHQQRSTVSLRRDKEVELSGYTVSSNSTGMLHSEHLTDLEGAVTLDIDSAGDWHVSNHSGLALAGAGVVRRGAQDAVEIAWIGALPDGAEAQLEFARGGEDLFGARRDDVALTAREHPRDTLSVREIVDLAESPQQLVAGDARLVAWLDSQLPGLKVEPEALQQRQAVVAVVHLRHGQTDVPQPDTNLQRQVKTIDDIMDQADEVEPTNSTEQTDEAREQLPP